MGYLYFLINFISSPFFDDVMGKNLKSGNFETKVDFYVDSS